MQTGTRLVRPVGKFRLRKIAHTPVLPIPCQVPASQAWEGFRPQTYPAAVGLEGQGVVLTLRVRQRPLRQLVAIPVHDHPELLQPRFLRRPKRIHSFSVMVSEKELRITCLGMPSASQAQERLPCA